MKLFLVFIGSISFAFANCVDLTGVYEFGGFNGKDCKINDEDTMHISPLPLGSVIYPNTTVEIKQTSCTDIKFVYRDGRYSNTENVDATYTLDLNKVVSTESNFSFLDVKSGTVHSGIGSLSSRDTKKWTLSLDSKKDLKVFFKYFSIGVFNYIIPNYDYVKVNCTLRRVD